MNENIDLTKILEGCEGIELYSVLHGNVTLKDIDLLDDYPISCSCKDSYGDIVTVFFSKYGKHDESFNGECILVPSKDQRDWSKFVRPIKRGTPIMCCEDTDDLKTDYWVYRKYTEEEAAAGWLYIIPFKNFDPNDIEGSIKNYNIQK